jgi:UDP-3-O-[3-hydroxymyristoyl] glucosamine N-acyltransferase
MSPSYAEALAAGRARAAALWEGADRAALGLDGAVLVPRPRLAMAGLTRLLDPGPAIAEGVHPTAVVDGAEIAPDARIGPLAVIGEGARIGAGVRVGPHATVGPGAQVGAGSILHAGARIAHGVVLGERVIVHPGASLGADGFSFVTEEEHALEAVRRTMADPGERPAQAWHRIHSLGGLVIGDDVEVGANACIDRGTIRATVIGSGTKIDNQVMVGHNCVVGRDCLLCAQVGVSGSVRVGDRVVMAGKVGIGDNLTIGDDAVLAGGAKVMSNVGRGRVMLGYPATRIEAQVEIYKALRRLPRMMRDLAASRKAVPIRGRSD